MDFNKFVCLLIVCLLIFVPQIMSQFGGIGQYPYGYGGIGGIFGRPGGYPMYGYYPQYPLFDSYPCYTSIYCGGGGGGGGGYGFGYGGYPFYQNSFNTGYSSSTSNSGFFSSQGGFFG